jgi:hypothetical protein
MQSKFGSDRTRRIHLYILLLLIISCISDTSAYESTHHMLLKGFPQKKITWFEYILEALMVLLNRLIYKDRV